MSASPSLDPSPLQPLLRAEGLERTYRVGEFPVHALCGVDLAVERGELVAIRGPSGSGKTTFMNLLGCLDRPTGGRYFLSGQDVSALDVDERAGVRNRFVGFVFQSFNLLARTTALENVEVPLFYGSTPAGEREARAREVLEEVGLADRAHHYPSQLSGGQQQRVAIARALVTRPQLMLADEPTGNLDTRTSLEIMALLQRLNRERALTILLVTHEEDISHFCRRLVDFRDGRVVADRPVDRVRDAAAELAAQPAVPAAL